VSGAGGAGAGALAGKTAPTAVKTAASKAKDEAAKMNKTMQAVIKSLEAIDGKTKFFATPVTEAIAPGYSKVISRPMDLSTVKAKMKVRRPLCLALGFFW
jgi:hypothetical protein